MFKKIAMSLATLGVAAGAYLRFIRPWQLRWGATDEEVARAMSGDDVVKQPTFNATRAVTIQARPEEIWPWLVQMGIKQRAECASSQTPELIGAIGHRQPRADEPGIQGSQVEIKATP